MLQMKTRSFAMVQVEINRAKKVGREEKNLCATVPQLRNVALPKWPCDRGFKKS